MLVLALNAEVAELVDALGSGSSGGYPVEVQVLSSAPLMKKGHGPNGLRPFFVGRAGMNQKRKAPNEGRCGLFLQAEL